MMLNSPGGLSITGRLGPGVIHASTLAAFAPPTLTQSVSGVFTQPIPGHHNPKNIYLERSIAANQTGMIVPVSQD